MTPEHPVCVEQGQEQERRRCPWMPDEWQRLGRMEQAQADQGREIGEIKKSVDDTNQTARGFASKLDMALVEMRKNGGGNGGGNAKVNKTATAGIAGAITAAAIGVLEALKAWLKTGG